MKKNFLLSLITVFLLPFFGMQDSVGQNPLVKQWDYRFGGNGFEAPNTVIQTMDGGFALAGISDSPISGNKSQSNRGGVDFWIVKIDSIGNFIWDRRFGGDSIDILNACIQTSDKGFILGGSSFSGQSGDKSQVSRGKLDYWVVKIDSAGNKQWDKSFGGSEDDGLNSIISLNDGGFILGGYTFSDSTGDFSQHNYDYGDFWILKIDSIGNKLWDRHYGGTDGDILHSLIKTKDGGYLLGGGSVSYPGYDVSQYPCGSGDYWILKVDSNFNRKWDKRYGGTSGELIYSIDQTKEGGFILGGISYSDSSCSKTQDLCVVSGLADYWVIKIDSVGDKMWDRNIGGDLFEDQFGKIFQTNDEGFILIGTSYSQLGCNKSENNLGQEQTWVVKIDKSGNIIWDKTISTLGHNEVSNGLQVNDGCVVFVNDNNGGIGGLKTQFSQGNYDFWIIKFCDTTSIFNAIPHPQIEKNPFVNIYPNPANDKINLNFNYPLLNVQIQIINILGSKIYESHISSQESSIDISILSAGIYFIKLNFGSSQFTQKFFKTH